ncbi:MAG: MFS transporter [SAR202 cluster bacterium]|nr:MFS transporter [SAR202 cluster bacterium]
MSCQWRAFLVGTFYICFGATERSAWPVLYLSVGEGLGASGALAAWTLVTFALGMAGSTLITGRLGDLMGHKRMAIIGFTAEGALLLSCAFMPSIWLILGLRLFQGMAASSALGNCQAFMISNFTREQRGRVVGLMAGSGAAGLFLGPLYAGLIGEHFGWRWAIAGLSTVMFTQSVLTAAFIRKDSDVAVDRRGAVRSLSWAGAGLVMASIASLVVGGQLMRLDQWRLAGALLLIAAAVGGFVLVRVERKAVSPVIRIDLFKSRAFATACAFLMWTSLSFSGTQILFPFFLQLGLGWTKAFSGWILTMLFAAQPFGAPIAGMLSDRLGSYRIFIAGVGFTVLGLVLGAALPDSAVWQQVVPILLIFSVGTSLTGPALSRLVVRDVARTAMGSATAMTVGTRYVGQSIGGALTAGILAAGATAPVGQTFRAGMLALALITAAGSVLILAVPVIASRLRGARTPPVPS